MRNEQYELQVESDVMVFEFTSMGPKGAIPKLVIYTETNVENIFNLGFGDKDLETDDIDDLIITDNKDSKKVLATVASTVYAFTYKYPDAWVAAAGSTKARTRLYQMGISSHLEEISTDFIIFGRKNKVWYPFEKNIAYDAFLIKRKII